MIETVDRIDKRDREGNRSVRIHGIGFPTMFTDAAFIDKVVFAVGAGSVEGTGIKNRRTRFEFLRLRP